MKIYPWGKLPACRFLNSRRLEAYATVRNELPLALAPIRFAYRCDRRLAAEESDERPAST
jgi:hypothetical protein